MKSGWLDGLGRALSSNEWSRFLKVSWLRDLANFDEHIEHFEAGKKESDI